MKESKSDRHILSRLSRLFRAHKSSHDLTLSHQLSYNNNNNNTKQKNCKVLPVNGEQVQPKSLYLSSGKAHSKSSLDLKSSDIKSQKEEMPESFVKSDKENFNKNRLNNLKSLSKLTKQNSDQHENAAIRKYILGIDDELDDIPLSAVNIIKVGGNFYLILLNFYLTFIIFN